MILKIGTLNIWAIPENPFQSSKFLSKRLLALQSALSTCDVDILVLQEAWICDSIKNSLLNYDKLKHNFPHYHYFKSGVFGSGLVTYSRYPIVGLDFHKFTLPGNPLKLHHSDFYSGKGVSVCYINTPIAGVISVYNTHTHAQYASPDEYHALRVHQVNSMAKFIRQTARGHVIFMGDLNAHPDSLEYDIMTKSLNLTDCWANDTNAYTFNVPENSYNMRSEPPETLDYILLGENIHVVDKKFEFQRIPNDVHWYSDHHGLVAEVEITNNSETSSQPINNELNHSKELLVKKRDVYLQKIDTLPPISAWKRSRALLILFAALPLITIIDFVVFAVICIFDLNVAPVLYNSLLFAQCLLLLVMTIVVVAKLDLNHKLDTLNALLHEVSIIDLTLLTNYYT